MEKLVFLFCFLNNILRGLFILLFFFCAVFPPSCPRWKILFSIYIKKHKKKAAIRRGWKIDDGKQQSNEQKKQTTA